MKEIAPTVLVSTHASVRRRPRHGENAGHSRGFNSRLREEATTSRGGSRGMLRFQLTPP